MSDRNFLLKTKPLLAGKHPVVQLLFLLAATILGMVVFSALALLIANAAWGVKVAISPTPHYYRLVQLFSALGTFLAPALLLSYCNYHDWFSYSKANNLINNVYAVTGVIILSVLLLPVISMLVLLNQQIHLPDCMAAIEEWMHEQQLSNDSVLQVMTAEHTVSTLLLNIGVCALVPAICEEFFFRGSLQNIFCTWFKNKHIAIWVTAFIFSAIHLQFDGFFARWLLGAYLGYLYVWSGSIWLPILAHFLHNALSIVLQFFIDVSGIPQPDATINSGIIISSLLAAAISGVIIWGTRIKLKGEK